METAAATAARSPKGLPWGARIGAPLVVVVLNLGFLMYWPAFMQWLDMRIVWAGWNQTIWLFEGWTLGSLVLLGVWLAFGGGRTRWLVAPVMASAGVLVASGPLHDTIWQRGMGWSYYLPQWGFLCLLIAVPLAGMHLFLHPLRVLLGLRMTFAPTQDHPTPLRRFQFRLHELLAVTAGIAIALAVIRGAYTILAHSGDSDLLGMPIYRLFCFGQILVPALACAWLILGHQRQWIGGLVLVLALACPWFLVQTSWYTYLSTVPSQLWPAHWMNLGAVACVAFTLVPLRILGLRVAVETPMRVPPRPATARDD